MAKYTVNSATNLVPVKVEVEDFSNAFKGDILGVAPDIAHALFKEGKISLVEHPKGTEVHEVNVTDAGAVSAVPAGMTSKPAAPAAA